MAEQLDLTPVADLIQLLRDQGFRAAQDPADLTPPGVLVQLQAFTRFTLGGSMRPIVRVFAVVPDGKHDRVTRDLVGLVNSLQAHLEPDGDVTATAVVLPSTNTALPALVFPLNLY